MATNKPCLVEVDVLAACNRVLAGAIQAVALLIATLIFCTAAQVSQLRENSRLAEIRNAKSTQTIVSSISRGQLLEEVHDYAENAKANKVEAHNLLVSEKLGIPPGGSN